MKQPLPSSSTQTICFDRLIEKPNGKRIQEREGKKKEERESAREKERFEDDNVLFNIEEENRKLQCNPNFYHHQIE